jgi:hypothetical protein
MIRESELQRVIEDGGKSPAPKRAEKCSYKVSRRLLMAGYTSLALLRPKALVMPSRIRCSTWPERIIGWRAVAIDIRTEKSSVSLPNDLANPML